MPLNRLIENSGGYAGFADNCHTPVNEKPEISSAALLLPKNRCSTPSTSLLDEKKCCLRLPQRFFCRRSIDGV